MMKISRFITKHSTAFLIGMLLLCVVCAFLMPQVNINTDMTKYLADDSPMKIGMDLMNEELDVSDSETIRVMFTGLTEDEKSEILDALSSIDYVDSVDYEADSGDYNSGDYTLYVINTNCEVGSDEETSIEDALDAEFSGCTFVYSNGDSTGSMLPMWLIAVALVLLIIILLVMSNSWVEPFLMIATIGIAIVINMGSNILLGTVSSTTYSISAILQLILLFHDLILKTTKRVPDLPFRHLSRGIFRFRKAFIPVFAVLFVVAYILQNNAAVSYTLDETDEIADIFPESNSIVMLYSNEDEDSIEALTASYEGASHAILTSGLIMILVTGILGLSSMVDPTVSQICLTIAIGTTCVVLLILFVLPGVLAAADRFVVRKQK